MGCSLRESIPVVLIEWQRWSCGDRGRGESGCLSRRLSAPSPCGHRFALAVSASRRMPRLTLQPSGAAQQWPPPCLHFSESPCLALRRVVGVVVVPGKPRSWPLRVGDVGSWCGSARPISPGPPPPLAWLAAVSVGNSLPPGQPAAPPSNSATARPLRGGAAALQPLPNHKPGLRLAARLRRAC